MALIFFMAYLDNRDNPSYLRLKQMAVSIADEIDWAGEEYNRFEKKRLRYIKAYIQGDLEDLRKQIEEEEDIGALPSICIVIESYIAACIGAGDNMGALAYLDKYMEYESAMRGEGIREYILPLKSKLKAGQKMEFLPWRVEKDPDRELDLLDVLDRISVKEEIWRYSQGRYTGLFPGIEKEGFFEMIQMPDGNASLVPCNPLFNSYYRGQSSYFEDCYPSLYRKGMSESQQGPGVFYHYVYIPDISGHEKLRAVGLQPFSRPGEQAGFVVKMSPGENFNKLVSEKIFFRHDPEVARFIFNYTNRSAKLFPSSILEEKAGQIKSSGKFSRAAFDAACDEFYPDTDKSVCLQYMMDCHAEITDSLIVKFTEKEKKDCLAEWEARGMKNTLDKILCRFVSL